MSSERSEHDEPERVVIRDKRKIDPTTGAPRPAEATASAEPAVEKAEVAMVEASLLDERTADLQRLQAEYANYRKRMERELQASEQRGVARALSALLPGLDDWDRAREHGDLTGPVGAIVDKQQQALLGLGLVEVGAEGDPFDPALHEAVLHDERSEVSRPTVTSVLRKGYQYNERLLRAAMVGVSDPADPADPATAAAGDPAGDPAGEAGPGEN